VSPPAVYLHFADKDELIFAVCQGLFTRLDEALESAAVGIDDPIEAMKARGRAYVRFGLEHPDHYRVLFMQPARAPPRTPTGPDEVKESAAFEHLVTKRRHPAGGPPGCGTTSTPTNWPSTAGPSWHGLTSLLISLPDFGWPDPDVFPGPATSTGCCRASSGH